MFKLLDELFPGGGPDVCIDCVGYRYPKSNKHKIELATGLESDSCDIVEECILSCKKGGRVILIGDYFGYCNHFPIGPMMEKNLTVTGG